MVNGECFVKRETSNVKRETLRRETLKVKREISRICNFDPLGRLADNTALFHPQSPIWNPKPALGVLGDVVF